MEVDVLSLKVTQTVQLLSNNLFYLLSQAFGRVCLELVALFVLELKQILTKDRCMDGIIGIVFNDFECADVIEVLLIHTCSHQN